MKRLENFSPGMTRSIESFIDRAASIAGARGNKIFTREHVAIALVDDPHYVNMVQRATGIPAAKLKAHLEKMLPEAKPDETVKGSRVVQRPWIDILVRDTIDTTRLQRGRIQPSDLITQLQNAAVLPRRKNP